MTIARKLLEKLDEIEQLHEEQMNESPIRYGKDLENGKRVSIQKAIKDVKEQQTGFARTVKEVTILKVITDIDIKEGLAKPEHKGYPASIRLPFSIVWGEPDPQGHGICHTDAKHPKEFNTAKQELERLINDKRTAKQDEDNPKNFILISRNFKFVLALTNDNGPWEIVLNSMYKLHK